MSDNILGKINVSQDGVICFPWSIAPTLTSGHGNCPKVVLCEEIIDNHIIRGGGTTK